MANEKKGGTDAVTIVKSKKYKRYADILCTVLDEGKMYTASEIDAILKDALAHKVTNRVNP